MKTNRLLSLILLLLASLLLAACGTLEAGVDGNSARDQTARATVAALSAENEKLATRIALLEQTRPTEATSDTVAIPAAAGADQSPLATATPIPAQANAVAATPTPAAANATAAPAQTAAITKTATPLATTTPAPTPTLRPPAPTATPGACREANAREKTVLTAVPQLECVTGAEQTLWMARQPFQHGQMIWRSDEPAMYVLYTDGTYERYEDQWTEGQMIDDPTLRAPAGGVQPRRGFGRVWRESLGGPKARIGWGTEEEMGMDAIVQQWKGGQIFRFGSDIFVLLNDGKWQVTR